MMRSTRQPVSLTRTPGILTRTRLLMLAHLPEIRICPRMDACAAASALRRTLNARPHGEARFASTYVIQPDLHPRTITPYLYLAAINLCQGCHF